MGRRRYTVKAIVHILWEAEVELAGSVTARPVAKKLGINEQTYHRWRKEHGSLRMNQALRAQGVRAGECPLEEAGW